MGCIWLRVVGCLFNDVPSYLVFIWERDSALQPENLANEAQVEP